MSLTRLADNYYERGGPRCPTIAAAVLSTPLVSTDREEESETARQNKIGQRYVSHPADKFNWGMLRITEGAFTSYPAIAAYAV